MSYFLDALKDYQLLPTIIQELGSDGIVNRFGMKSIDNSWSLNITSNRIDIILNFNQRRNYNSGLIINFFEGINTIGETINNKFAKSYVRLAFLVNYLVEVEREEETDAMYSKFFKTLNLFEGKNIVEWKNRSAIKIPLT